MRAPQGPPGPYSPIQPAPPQLNIRRGCSGCLLRLHGCATVLAALALLLVALWVITLFVPVPFLVFLNPLPYYRQYTWVMHHGHSAVYAVAWSPDGKRLAIGGDRFPEVWQPA
jgi:hypothetical protein